MRLEESQLAHAFSRNAAGRKVGDTSRFEFQPYVGDVNFTRQYGQAHRANFLHRRIGEGKDDVEVVDHQVEYDVDVQRSWSEDAEAVHLEEHGLSKQRESGANCGIEAFEMPYLSDSLARGGHLQQFIGFVER